MQRSSTPQQSQSLRFAVLLFTGVALCAASLNAQTFQYAYGNPTCRDAGRSVVYIPTGGWLTAGESFADGCATSDVYVVRTNSDGSLLWSYTYDLQGNDVATDVTVCANGDFVISGTTNAAGSQDIFLLRITSTGGLVAMNVFGGPMDDYGSAVLETAFGDGVFTFPGDIVVVGWTGPTGARNAFWIRTTGGLAQITNTVLFPNMNNRDDYFYDVTEATVNPGAGDLVAVGGSSSWTAAGTDVYAVRFDENGTPLNQSLVGGGFMDEGRSVTEILAGVNVGDFAIAGSTLSRPGAFTANLDAYVVQLFPALGAVRGDIIFGHPSANDELFGIVEDIYSGFILPGLIVTGYTNVQAGMLTGQNMLLQRLSPSAAAIVGPGRIFGGSRDDQGLALADIGPQPVEPFDAPGYAMAGFTTSPELIGTDPQQLYLVRANALLESGCNEQPVLFNSMSPPWVAVAVAAAPAALVAQQIGAVTAVERTWETDLCPDDPEGQVRRRDTENGVAGMEVPGHTHGTLAARSYPNPIRSGRPLNLGFDLTEASPAVITVTDMQGNTVVRHEKNYGAGAVMMAIPTEGWASGTYLVQIQVGEQITRNKVVVDAR